MQTFPSNPGTSLRLAEIAIMLEGIQSNSIFAESIFSALRAGRVKEIVKEIYEQSKDNRGLVSFIVGEKTLQKIESLWSY